VPVSYSFPRYRSQPVWYTYTNNYYQTAYSPASYQLAYTPQYYEVSYTQQTEQTAGQSQGTEVAAAHVTQASYEAPAAAPAEAAPAAAEPAVFAGDPYGFTSWLNATRAAYGLPAVGYDPNLAGWAAMNNNHQASYGIGHFVMGPRLIRLPCWTPQFDGSGSPGWAPTGRSTHTKMFI
jgi:hypothetical protein